MIYWFNLKKVSFEISLSNETINDIELNSFCPYPNYDSPETPHLKNQLFVTIKEGELFIVPNQFKKLVFNQRKSMDDLNQVKMYKAKNCKESMRLHSEEQMIVEFCADLRPYDLETGTYELYLTYYHESNSFVSNSVRLKLN